jgi:hypothetical protein
MLERLRSYLREQDEIEAVVSQNPTASTKSSPDGGGPGLRMPEAESPVSANKRIRNILRNGDAGSARSRATAGGGGERSVRSNIEADATHHCWRTETTPSAAPLVGVQRGIPSTRSW